MNRVTMELGGHAPVIVAKDAAVNFAVSTAGLSTFHKTGQVCISLTQFSPRTCEHLEASA
ncbi:aldehyde dehydrogenase family protein [Pseudomonas putida]|uniref:aldehyde dehydrogenase family protein n=1 Tax=Pseudomonas putida TaxID=303 RepID=UPI003D35145A